MAAVNVTCYIVAIFVLQNHLAGGTECIYGGSSDCVFSCNCADNASCDIQTGACPNGCRYGQPRPVGNETRFDWRGPGCRIGNVALHKVVSQKGVYGKWYANHSVDGKLPSTESEHESTCAHTAVGGKIAWWSVDLQENHQIYSITIFNRKDEQNGLRTANFTIRVGNNSDISMNPLCRYYPGRVPAGGSATLTCTSTTIGRYVSMHRIGGPQPHVINICEVVVMGYEIIPADCSRCITNCNDLVGCSNCSGYRSPQCLICDGGRYGINCASTCSDHQCKGGYMTCDNVTGECPDGCQDWYIDGKCDTLIDEVGFDEILSIEGVNATHINVIWGSDDDISSNLAQYYGYQIHYKASDDSEFLSGPNVSCVPGVTEYRAIISGLHYNTRYILGVSVYRKHGGQLDIPPSPTREVEVKTPCISPDPVTLLSLTFYDDMGTIRLHVVWKATSSGCDNISSVLVWYKPNTTDEWMTHDVMNPATSTCTSITDLADGVWGVKVRVMNNEEISSESETRSITIIENTMKTPPATTIAPNNQVNFPCSDAYTRLAIPFAGLFGMSAIVNIVLVIHCVWIKLSKMRTNTASVKTPATGHATDIYEGLGARISIDTESQYDELRMDESQVTREPEYEPM